MGLPDDDAPAAILRAGLGESAATAALHTLHQAGVSATAYFLAAAPSEAGEAHGLPELAGMAVAQWGTRLANAIGDVGLVAPSAAHPFRASEAAAAGGQGLDPG